MLSYSYYLGMVLFLFPFHVTHDGVFCFSAMAQARGYSVLNWRRKLEKTLSDINQRRHKLPEEKNCRFPLSEDIACLVPFKLVSTAADPSSISDNSHQGCPAQSQWPDYIKKQSTLSIPLYLLGHGFYRKEDSFIHLLFFLLLSLLFALLPSYTVLNTMIWGVHHTLKSCAVENLMLVPWYIHR